MRAATAAMKLEDACFLEGKLWQKWIVHNNFMAAVTICSDFGAQMKFGTVFHFFLFHLPWSDGTRCHNFSFFNAQFQASFFTRLCHPHQETNSSSLSAVWKISSAYLRLLIFLLEILIPACDSSRPALLMMYSAHKLNRQGDSIQPCHTPFPIMNQSVVPCLVLTVVSWPTYRFLRW